MTVALGPEYDRLSIWSDLYKDWLKSLKVGDCVLIDVNHRANAMFKVITRETKTRFYYDVGITEDYFHKKDGSKPHNTGYAHPFTKTFENKTARIKKIKAIREFNFEDASDEFIDKIYGLSVAEQLAQ